MRARVVGLLLALVIGFGAYVPAPASASHEEAIVDFEGLAEGAIVSSVSCGSGIDCSGLSVDPGGSIGVSGDNPDFDPGTNAAIIFDADCTDAAGTDPCTGNDPDLMFPELGNILIIAENLQDEDDDGNVDDPDDADVFGASFNFVFSSWGEGTVQVVDLVIADVEESEDGGYIQPYSDASFSVPIGSPIVIPVTGDHAYATVDIGASGVASMTVFLGGSAAIDNLRLRPEHEEEDGGGEGCTPGFWKTHKNLWGPTGYSTSDDFDTVFGTNYFSPDINLGQAIGARGGGLNRLARHGTAALLNAAHPGVSYDLTVAEVIAAVQAGDADLLVELNEQGCPLGGPGG
jgi:hypothetical protein